MLTWFKQQFYCTTAAALTAASPYLAAGYKACITTDQEANDAQPVRKVLGHIQFIVLKPVFIANCSVNMLACKRQISRDYWTNDAERVTQLESLIGPASAMEHPSCDHVICRSFFFKFCESKFYPLPLPGGVDFLNIALWVSFQLNMFQIYFTENI